MLIPDSFSFFKKTQRRCYGPSFTGVFYSAVDSIRYLGRRAILAFAGIAVGSAAVTALINVGNMAQLEAVSVFKGMGSDLVVVNLQPSPGQIAIGLLPREFDAATLLSSLPEIKTATGIIFTSSEVRRRGNVISSLIIGDSGSLPNIMRLSLAEGRFLGRSDADSTYAVVGNNVAKNNGKDSLKTGDKIFIGNYVYEIVGVLSRHGENLLFPFNPDDAVILPIDGMKRVMPVPLISSVLIRYKSSRPVSILADKLHEYFSAQKSGISINVQIPETLIDGMTQQSRLFNWLLICIGGVSMLAGGIGIMNVMLMNVSERKKEIGLRLAIGARPKDITIQFLMESVILSAFGTAAGCMVGIVGAAVFFYFSGWPDFTITLSSLLLAAGSSLATGLFFGLYPAVSAAHIEPVKALNDA